MNVSLLPEIKPLKRNDLSAYLYVQTLPVEVDLLNEFEQSLNAEEKNRAKRYHFKKDADRFMVARGLLRKILAVQLELSPAEIVFSYAKQGKPSLDPNIHPQSFLQFNVSHSQDRILIGWCAGHAIGVDIESIDRRVEVLDIAERFFSLKEKSEIASLSADLQRQAFFNAWTRKEAILKTLGSGLSLSLDLCEVTVLPHEKPRILALPQKEFKLEEWQLYSQSLSEGYLMAAMLHASLQVIVLQ